MKSEKVTIRLDVEIVATNVKLLDIEHFDRTQHNDNLVNFQLLPRFKLSKTKTDGRNLKNH